MVHYYFKINIPSLDRKVSFREITIREFININKSILNNDYLQISECFDLIINECCLEKDIQFTLIDKIIILLAIRAYSISTFCNIKITDNEVQQEFDHKIEINDLIESILQLPIAHKKVCKLDGVEVEYGIPRYPINDVNVVVASEYIHCIKHNDNIIIDYTNNQKDIQLIIDSLDIKAYTEITNYAKELNETFNNHPLYKILSPWDASRTVIIQRMSLGFKMYDMLKLLFTENLHNLYRTLYTFNTTLNIPPSYTENMIPVEKDLIWGYHLKDQRDNENGKANKSMFQP